MWPHPHGGRRSSRRARGARPRARRRLRLLVLAPRLVPRRARVRRRRRSLGRGDARRRAVAAGVPASVLGSPGEAATGAPGTPAPHRGRARRGRRHPAQVDVPDRRGGQRGNRVDPWIPRAGAAARRRIRDLAVRRARGGAGRRRDLPARSPAWWSSRAPRARREYLARLEPGLRRALHDLAVDSEDAFDAAVVGDRDVASRRRVARTAGGHRSRAVRARARCGCPA